MDTARTAWLHTTNALTGGRSSRAPSWWTRAPFWVSRSMCVRCGRAIRAADRFQRLVGERTWQRCVGLSLRYAYLS